MKRVPDVTVFLGLPQTERSANTEPKNPVFIATVREVAAQGVRIQMDGEQTAGQKYYKRLSSYTPANGDRVLLARISGTIVILGKIV